MNRSVKALTGAVVFLLLISGDNVLGQKALNEKQISLDMATNAAMAVVKQCREDGFRVSIVVLDRGGNVKVAMRDDNAGLHTTDSARRKAFTALTFRISTAEFAKRVTTTPALGDFEGVLALPGGLPIRSGDEVIGSIGVGGAPSGTNDELCAQAGIDKIKGNL